jgi:hypothetical protein
MKSNKINFEKLKIWQKVWCIQLGYCNVCETNYTEIYIHNEKSGV